MPDERPLIEEALTELQLQQALIEWLEKHRGVVAPRPMRISSTFTPDAVVVRIWKAEPPQ